MLEGPPLIFTPERFLFPRADKERDENSGGSISTLRVPPRNCSPEFASPDIAYCRMAAVCIIVRKSSDFFGRRPIISRGSGFWIESEGGPYILTNEHVVGGINAKRTDVSAMSLNQKSAQEIEVVKVGRRKKDDIALLKPTDSSFRPAVSFPLASSEALVQGAPVLICGFPGGVLPFNMGRGFISSLEGFRLADQITLDASVNPGNSGGPVFIMENGFVRIAAMIRSKSSLEGICFAIPSDTIRRAIDEILDTCSNRGS